MSAYAWFLIAVGLPLSLLAQAIHITGRIPCAGRLVLANAGPSVSGESSGQSVQVRITDVVEDRVPVVLSLRTNCGYRVAAEWMGHSTVVADKHYWRVTDADFDRAIQIAQQKAQQSRRRMGPVPT